MIKLRFFIGFMIISIISFTGCSGMNGSNSESEEVVALSEESAVSDYSEVEAKVKKLLENESYKLIWNVKDKEIPDTVSMWEVAPVNIKELWNQMKTDIFAQGEIQPEGSSTSFQMLFDDQMLKVQIWGDHIMTIQGKMKSEIYEKTAKLLSKETGMNCVKTAKGYRHEENYCFQVDGIFLDTENHVEDEKTISGSYCNIDANEMFGIVYPVKKLIKGKQIDLKESFDEQELKLLCKIKWLSQKKPQVCVLDNMKLVYLLSSTVTDIYPAWRITGKAYMVDTTGEVQAQDVSFLVNLVTGEIF
ncbi:MAG: hypothetical protein Q4F21_06105 [Lachnospiraceae bacterium]|nr:hypothetical protein [Lachnospiraceae bacterium]